MAVERRRPPQSIPFEPRRFAHWRMSPRNLEQDGFMKNLLGLVLSLLSAGALAAANVPADMAEKICTTQYSQCLSSFAPREEKEEGISSSDYVWNAKDGDKVAALKLKGDIARGKKSYEICAACHLSSGSGLPNIGLPQLAGQHTTVIIKQLSDLRAGLRYSPTMEPFALTRRGPQELADLAAYIESLCTPLDHGKYNGSDVSQKIAEGKAIYAEKCRGCHGAEGKGDKARSYPVIAGQHYQYLMRQLIEIRDGTRQNSNPDMISVLKKFSDDDRAAVSAYMASLIMPGKMCPAAAEARKE
jgi:cytochrome c553